MKMAFRILTIAGMSLTLFMAAQSAGNVTLPQDKGPDKVNVSAYPAEQQKGYKVFTEKCSKCHSIARPINTTMTDPEWSRYVKRMMHKPNSGISDVQGKTIYEFLAYDQENRKDKSPSAFFKSLSDEEIEKLKAEQH
jgi:mono/diheme cytochrome c family protein